MRAEHKPQGKPCTQCGRPPWQHRKPRDRRGRKRLDGGHGARTRRRELTRFVGIDGEGVKRNDGTHDYVLLTVGTEILRHDGPGRLTWKEIFPFLYECFELDPHAAYVGFFLGYDFTQWLRTLPQDRAESLLTERGKARRQRKLSGGNTRPFPVYIGDEANPWQWEIDILGMKRFKIRPGTGAEPGESKNTNKWMHICDVGAFFQTSFLVVLQGLMGKDGNDESILTKTELETIKEGKERRDTHKLDDDMIRYNLLECELLARIMPLLNEGFKGCDIKLSAEKWFGPGQAAQQWMTNIGAPTREEIETEVPAWAREVGRKTYFGGWFEIFAHGPIPGTSWEYDINSAYPMAISELPCLLHGKWKQGKSTSWKYIEKIARRSTLVAVHGLAKGSDRRVGSLLHRTEKGRVLRPRKTSGWYWLHEIHAAMKAGILDTFKPDEWVSYEGCACPKPFRAMIDLYNERLRVGKNSPRGKAFKLIYNSSYGKCAQSIGQPKFANALYASLITCSCRTRVLTAIATHPKKTLDLIMVATDGVYFRTKHPGLKLDPEKLGAWSESSKENMLLFMPGLYWDDASRKALNENKGAKLKSRGVPGRSMAKKILEADGMFERFRKGGGWPEVEINIDFSMVTPKQALIRGKWETCGDVSNTAKRIIKAVPWKKRKAPDMVGRIDVLFTVPYDRSKDLESAPYSRRFGDERLELNARLPDETPEGSAMMLMREHLGL